MKYLLLPLVVLAGVAIPVQVAANSKLRDAVESPALAILIAFVIGSLGLAALTLAGVLGRGQLSGAGQVPWWAWAGGLLSAFAVLCSMVALKPLGAGPVISAMVFGQLTTAMVLDHFGWLDVERSPVNAWKVVGAILLLAGAVLMQRK